VSGFSTVESSANCRFDRVGRGIGTALYRALFDTLEGEEIGRYGTSAGSSVRCGAAAVITWPRCQANRIDATIRLKTPR
jgi:hypothetical protein